MISRWTASRVLISAFVLFHITGTVVWIVPESPIRQQLIPCFRPYMLPLGLWQSWWMFAPNPMGATAEMEAEVIDAQGMRHLWEFPRVAGISWWRKLPLFRHPKFTCNMIEPEGTTQREFTARHAVRRLNLGPESFPVHTTLLCRVKEPPPPGKTRIEAPRPTQILVLGTYDFASYEEVHP
ncbi:hypothetical protein OJF2_20580 [Aquisphaera giovannonii]|uniref:Uncharacterized protein n=1 Tax=Aquisphaera giovannonii TaxID=406548 RepID=A0A5B9VYW2_9BACT|nr:hypothetical protein [Aquisphaera giovannonii]QEH33556.1 hypothetical protein OJF2_20580 [Aquisphaera giovannonii]